MEPLAEPRPPAAIAGRKSALAFFGVLLALYLPGAVAQAALLPVGLAWTELFAFLLPALVLTAGSNLRAVPYLRLGPARPATLALGALAGVAGYVFAGSLVAAVQRLVPAPWVRAFDPARLFDGPAWHAVLLAAVATVLAPVCEEIAFRGYVQTTLALRRPPAVAIGGAALLFALLHLNPVLFPALVLLGAVFGWLAWRAGSVWPAVAAHAANNAITSALVLALDEAPRAEPPPLAALLPVAGAGAAALALILFAYAGATPSPPPAAAAVALRDAADPSVGFSWRRVPTPLVVAALAGGALLAMLLAAAAVSAALRLP